jgi:hypothetical protein
MSDHDNLSVSQYVRDVALQPPAAFEGQHGHDDCERELKGHGVPATETATEDCAPAAVPVQESIRLSVVPHERLAIGVFNQPRVGPTPLHQPDRRRRHLYNRNSHQGDPSRSLRNETCRRRATPSWS